MAKSTQKKIFVLDTSVILYNHASLLSFEDNDVAIPITVLEELDNFKKGHDTKNYEAREFIRIIDRLSQDHSLQDWVSMGEGKGKIKVIIHENGTESSAVKLFGADKADHRIINAALTMSRQYPRKRTVLVTKDINLRIKAKSMNLASEDFQTGKVKDIEKLYTGRELLDTVDKTVIDEIYKEGRAAPAKAGIENPMTNNYYILRTPSNQSVLTFYNPQSEMLEHVEKRTTMRITPRNAEQVFAMHAILNKNVKLVTLQGVAGTGKTLLALAGALEQRAEFKQIYLARPIVPLSNKDIGFLPGDAKEKIGPYMEPLYDNLKFIKNQYGEKDQMYTKIEALLESEKLLISPLAYIRGRSLSNIIFIVDEAQNLTPHEVKTIITRAGENTKIIFTGDIYQIDTPYLDAQSNGLSYLIDKIRHHSIFAHVRLEKGERSELANLANDML
jgi:PhoH-like ATPase